MKQPCKTCRCYYKDKAPLATTETWCPCVKGLWRVPDTDCDDWEKPHALDCDCGTCAELRSLRLEVKALRERVADAPDVAGFPAPSFGAIFVEQADGSTKVYPDAPELKAEFHQ